jgi:hypothetical protein
LQWETIKVDLGDLRARVIFEPLASENSGC